MKKIFYIVAIGFSGSLFAQKNNERYHIFMFDEKYGLTDTLNNEVLPPQYWQPEQLYAKKQWIFKNDNEGVIFSRTDGKLIRYEEVRSYHLKHQDSMYMRITDKGKMFLLNQYSDTKYNLPKGRERIESVGNYFYLEESVYPESKSVKDPKTGMWLPPKTLPAQNKFMLFSAPSDAKPILTMLATNVIPLWKYNEKIDDYAEGCDYIAFTTDKQIKIYDSRLKLLKTIAKSGKDNMYIDNLISEAIGIRVYQRVVPPSYSSSLVPKHPLLIVRKQGVQSQVYIEQEHNDQSPVFIFATNNEVALLSDAVLLKKDKINVAKFDVNLDNGHIYLPEKYLAQLELDFSGKSDNQGFVNEREDGEIFIRVEQSAEYPGGVSAMSNFIGSNLNYPDNARESGVSGRVIAKFVIEKDGTISNIQIAKSLSKECDEEVLRIIKRMPKWLPARHHGVAVRSIYNLPIVFRTE